MLRRANHLPSRGLAGFCTLALAAWLVLPGLAWGQVPNLVGYQGLLLDANGNPVTGAVNIELGVWTDPLSTAPADLLYNEVHLSVGVVDGVFQVELGGGGFSVGTFDASLYAAPGRWLEIIADGEVLMPRQSFLTVPYAFRAQSALTAMNADTLNGTSAADFARTSDVAAVESQLAAIQTQLAALQSTVDGIAGVLEVCGDSFLNPGEQCDDGNQIDGDGCSSLCLSEVCGNGTVDIGEACDDGNSVSGDGCSSDCLSDETCGNGITDTSAGEVCDDGNTVSGDGCSSTCSSNETCGNGFVDPGEVCDDGNTVSGDGCSSTCLSDESCGNGIVDSGEVCDDGNTVSGDGCSSDCLSDETCGNAACDLGEDCTSCPADCGACVCGDGTCNPDEDCTSCPADCGACLQ